MDAKWQHNRPQRRLRMLLKELSFLFNSDATLKLVYPEIRLRSWKSTITYEVSGVHARAHENLRLQPPISGRTNNRIRSPRCIASGHVE